MAGPHPARPSPTGKCDDGLGRAAGFLPTHRAIYGRVLACRGALTCWRGGAQMVDVEPHEVVMMGTSSLVALCAVVNTVVTLQKKPSKKSQFARLVQRSLQMSW